MKTNSIKAFIILYLLIFYSTQSRAEIIINEVLVNEPGSVTSLEWIELYNNSDEDISLISFTLNINNSSTIIIPDSISLASNEYYVICRRLFEKNGSVGFESYWGDSSGVWGDNEYESSFQKPLESSFNLTNTGGSIVLYKNGIEISSFIWDDGGDDAVSWERIYPDSVYFSQSQSVFGATPGYLNSISLVPNDISIDSVDVRMESYNPIYSIYISNKGSNNTNSGYLYLSLYDSLSVTSPFDSVEVQSLIPSETREIVYNSNLFGYYHQVLANLSNDERSSNDSLIFIGIGSDYPPVIISEIMANPNNGLLSEWVEIKNISNIPINLSNWQIGDELNNRIITSDLFVIEPNEYIIVAQSLSDMIYSYSGIMADIIEPSNWSYFNNDGDFVRLIDNYGIEADNFAYSFTFDENYSWSRDINLKWGRSFEQFGSPGHENNVLFEASDKNLSINVVPKYFSPDSDGLNDDVEIIIQAPQADNFSVKIYDRYGRIVKVFYNKSSFVPDSVSLKWNGYSDSNKRLPIGIYIIYVEAKGVGDLKETVVITR